MKYFNTLCQFAIVASFTFCLVIASSAFGAMKYAEKEYRTSTGGAGALTPAMIRNCISMKKSLDEQAAEAAAAKKLLDDMDAEIKQTEEQLLEEEKSMDQSDNDAIARHNGRITALRERLAEYQAKTKEYNSKITPYLSLEKKYKKLCDNQDYYDDDYEQAKKEMGYGLD